MAGYPVFQAYDGRAAIELCFELPDIRLLILNTHVDGLNSLALIERVRDRHPGIPILHIDTHRDDGLPTDIPTLTEPFTAAELMECVATLIAPVRPAPEASEATLLGT
jgi:Response regulators consisting of a CheY-like receiver domain and a winged-helix DNA-binding domain